MDSAVSRDSFDAIVYGTVCLDRFVRVGGEGEPLTHEIQELPGGEAFNTAAALAGWGVQVALTGTALGIDAESDRLRHLLDKSPLAEGIDRRFLIEKNPVAVTPVCTIRVFPDGERQMNGRGFAQAVAPLPLPPSLFASRPWFVTDPNLGSAAVTQALAAAEQGCPLIAMDFAPVPEIVAVSRVLVTSREMLSKQRIPHENPQKVAQHLCRGGAQTAIVTLGVEGCVVADREWGTFHQPAFLVPGIQDTTGAGDTFRAGLVYGLQRNLLPSAAVRFASAAAALHCTEWGGGSRIPLPRVVSLPACLSPKGFLKFSL